MNEWQAQLNLVTAHVTAGRHDEAGRLLAAMVIKQPDDPVVAHLQGVIAFSSKRYDAAVNWFTRAAREDVDNAELLNNLGQAYRANGQLINAATAFERAAKLDSGFAEPMNNLGMLFRNDGKFDKAVECYQDALARQDHYPEAHYNLALAFEQQGERNAAADHYARAISQRPDYTSALSNLGNLLMSQGRHAEAEKLFLRALALDPKAPEILINLGNNLRAQGRLEDAAQSLRQCLAVDPSRQEAHFNLALIKLALGKYRTGWDHYRYRHSVDRAKLTWPRLPWPAKMNGRRVLIEGEQGLGDQLYLLRFVPELKARGATVWFRPDAKVASLCRRLDELDGVISNSETPTHDEICALGDLPFLLQSDGTPASLRLVPEAHRCAGIEAALHAFGPPPYIGVTYRAGSDAAGALFKAVPIEELTRQLARMPGSIVNLQRAPSPGENARMEAALGRRILDFTKLNGDPEEMLAVLDLLDDYVGVSNTNMHLRASLGRPARVLVTHPAEYRWMAEGARSPWFPIFSLYRQGVIDDWSAAFAALSADLTAAYDE